MTTFTRKTKTVTTMTTKTINHDNFCAQKQDNDNNDNYDNFSLQKQGNDNFYVANITGMTTITTITTFSGCPSLAVLGSGGGGRGANITGMTTITTPKPRQ